MAYPRDGVNLQNCAEEPIHVPGSVQPHGALLEVDAHGIVIAYSANLDDPGASFAPPSWPVGDGIGRSLESFGFRPGLFAGLTSRRHHHTLPVPWDDTLEARFHVNVQGRRIVEIERSGKGPSLRRLRKVVSLLQRAPDLSGLCDVAATQFQHLLGYDRVMVYRFDDDDHGEVIAEAVGPDIATRFLGQHFPEGDIPAQARRMYLEQPSRMIADVAFEPVPLVGEQESLDLSNSVLRSVSPIHCEYLQNMGVAASQSFSIVHRGRLWGLVACHHHRPHLPSPSEREAGILALEILIGRLGVLLAHEEADANQVARERLERPLSALAEAQDLERGMGAVLGELTALLGCDGAMVASPQGTTLGDVPEGELREQLLEICRERDALWSTDRLPRLLPIQDRDAPCGMLCVPFDSQSYLLFFRNEATFGRPYGHEVKIEGRLTPPGSFDVFLQQVRGQSRPWSVYDRMMAKALYAGVLEVRARRNRLLQQRNQELEEASRAKDAFLAILSHELRNPLNAIVGWSTLLVSGRVPDERRPEAFQAIHRNARTQQRLIDDLLDVTRIANGKVDLRLEVLDLELPLEEALSSMRAAAEEKDIRLFVHTSSCGAVEADAGRIQQIMWNLIGNAIKYTASGGKVYVRLYPRGSSTVFEVQDTGRGISRQDLPHLFDRFYRVNEADRSSPGGLGLGLSIVGGLAKLHGARVDVESQLGNGSTFRVMFPVSTRRGEGEVVTGPVNLPGDAVLAGKTLVVVDDQSDSTRFLAMVLREAGAEVHPFSDPSKALSFLGSDTPVDLLISDVNMMPFDGYELARRVHELPNRSGLMMIAVTAYATAKDRITAYRAGFCAHVAKPVDTDELLAVVAAHVERA